MPIRVNHAAGNTHVVVLASAGAGGPTMLPRLSLYPHVGLPEGTKPLGKGIFDIQLGVLQPREKCFASCLHPLDDGGPHRVVQGPLVRLADAANEQNVIISRNKEDHLIRRVCLESRSG